MSSIDRRTGRLKYANVTATLALFLALGGVAAAAGTLINGTSIKPRSLPANRLKLHTLTAAEIRIPPERLIGAPGEPAFGASWMNAGSGFQAAGFYRDAEGVVHLRGSLALGKVMTIFTLPIGYRPAATEEFNAALNTAGNALIFVTAAGDVDLEFINSSLVCNDSRCIPNIPTRLILSQISFRNGI